MKVNESNVERIIRVILGVSIFVVLWLMGGDWQVSQWWSLAGLVPITTGSIGVCPLYSILGIATCKGKTCEKA